MPIIGLQKRARELGRIRLGQKGDKGQPQKLDRFRFTGHSETLLSKIADLYGGEVQPWTPAGGTAQYEVISNTTRVPIMVPPQPVTQWHEAWKRSGIAHRCDGHTNALTDEPCDPEDPLHLEALGKPTTRLNVVLRDVEGIGVWRVETHGWNAAIELPDVAQFLSQAGGYVNGWLSLEQRTSIDNTGSKPQTRHYIVPIIEIDVTPAQLMAGHGRVAAPALTGGPVGDTPALAASGPDYVALAADVETTDGIRDLWRQAKDAGHMTDGLSEHLSKRAKELQAPATEPETNGTPEPELVEVEVVDDNTDAVWQQVLTRAGELSMSLWDVDGDFKEFTGIQVSEADASAFAAYLSELQNRQVVA